MKIRVTIIVLAISVFFFVGCAGTPVSISRFGAMQPSTHGFIQQETRIMQSGYEVAEFVPGSFNLLNDPFGFNGLNTMFETAGSRNSLASLTHFPLFVLDNSVSRFVFNNYWSNQDFVANGSLFNPDGSITLLGLGNVQFKLMPAMDGRWQ